MDLYIKVRSFSHETRARDEDDAWDQGNSQTTWYVDGVYLKGDKSYSVPLDFDVKAGDTIYLLYAIYSTGNSFGHDDRGRIEFFLAYKTSEKAYAAEKILSQAKDWTVEIESEMGKKIPSHVPWLGYFESLDDVYVDSFIVKERE